jgi:hypothetical protein
VEVAPASTSPVRVSRLSPALARAYAAVGELRDGRRQALPPLDTETMALLDQAGELLALDRPVRGEGRPTRLPGGETMAIADRPASAAVADAVDRPRSERSASPPPGDALSAVEADRVQQRLAQGGATQPLPMVGDLVKDLIAPDAWVAIPYQPAAVGGQPLVINNRSGFGYAVSFHGDDFGGVRVNGGLVVPGRHYRLDGSMQVTSDVPVNVHIRPLSAVPTFFEQPRQWPNANG